MKARLFNVLLSVLLFANFSPVKLFSADKMQKTFSGTSGGRLEVTVEGGAIEVTGGTLDQTTVVLECSKDIEEHYNVTIEKQGNSVVVSAKRKGEGSFGFLNFLSGRWPSLKVSAQVPRLNDVNLKTSGGHLEITGLEGSVDAKTSGGGIACNDIRGNVTVYTSGGSVSCEQITGSLEARTSGGGIHLASITGPFNAKTSGGRIEAEALTGDGSLATSGGGIEVNACNGRLDAATSGGSIEVSGHEGAVTTNTGGGNISVTFNSPPAGDCEMKTSAGSIRLAIPRQSNAYVDAKTSSGRVSTDLPILVQGDTGRGELHGQIGESGPTLTLKTSGGSIKISALD